MRFRTVFGYLCLLASAGVFFIALGFSYGVYKSLSLLHSGQQDIIEACIRDEHMDCDPRGWKVWALVGSLHFVLATGVGYWGFVLALRTQPNGLTAQSSVAPDGSPCLAPASAGAPSSAPRVNAGIGQTPEGDGGNGKDGQ